MIEAKEDNKDGTVGKALAVLDLVASYGRPVRFARLLKDGSYPKATLYRFLQTLTNQGMLQYDEEAHTYSVGMRLMRFAHAAWQQTSLAPIARPYLDELAGTTGESVHLAQIENGQVLFVDKRQSPNLFETLAQAGRVAPAYCTGVGKVILAFMDEERRQRALIQQAFVQYTPNTIMSLRALKKELASIQKHGVGFDKEEHQEGIISIAAPILSTTNRVIGAISIATATSRYDVNGIEKFTTDLLNTTKKIGEVLETWQAPDYQN